MTPRAVFHSMYTTALCVSVCVALYLAKLSAIALPLHLPGIFAGLQALEEVTVTRVNMSYMNEEIWR